MLTEGMRNVLLYLLHDGRTNARIFDPLTLGSLACRGFVNVVGGYADLSAIERIHARAQSRRA